MLRQTQVTFGNVRIAVEAKREETKREKREEQKISCKKNSKAVTRKEKL